MARRSAVPGEYVGDFTLLKVCDDGTVFLGTEVGAVITAHVLDGDVPVERLQKPLHKKEASALARLDKHVGRTPDREMVLDGAMRAYATKPRGGDLVIQVFQDPKSRQECVAGWSGRLHRWVVE